VALTADEIAREAQFFPGTNDLTQTMGTLPRR
jgi:phosphoenolpyruvate-protein kinase (PTS system EI component)